MSLVLDRGYLVGLRSIAGPRRPPFLNRSACHSSPMTQILDTLQRPMRALRVSVTDRCNFRCTYCMPRDVFGSSYRFLNRSEILSFEEIERLVAIFARLGVAKVRLTGGEPLLRKDLPTLVGALRSIPGISELTLTTNGVLLRDLAEPLKSAGLDRVTVSLDSLDPQRFQAIADTRVPLATVLEGIEEARRVGLTPLKLNCVLQRGENEDDLIPLAAFARSAGYTLRFIEFMDVGTQNGWHMSRVIPAQEILNRVGDHFPLEPIVEDNCKSAVAQRYRYRDGQGELGVIASVTAPFCSGCDRARLSAQGKLYTCLFAADGMDLKSCLRQGASDDDLYTMLMNRWKRRDDRYSELRSLQTIPTTRPEMFQLGG